MSPPPRTVLEVVETGEGNKQACKKKKIGLSCFDIWTECQSCPERQDGLFFDKFQQTWVDVMGDMCGLFSCLRGARNEEVEEML